MKTHPPPTVINESDILEKFTPSSFDRGRDYCDSGMVERTVRRGNRLFARVQGSSFAPYSVTAVLRGRDFEASCDCPYDWGGYCKHIAATMLFFIQDARRFAEGVPLEDALARMDADDLRALVIRMIEANPYLLDELEGSRLDRPRPS